jgi:hypothetical protein
MATVEWLTAGVPAAYDGAAQGRAGFASGPRLTAVDGAAPASRVGTETEWWTGGDPGGDGGASRAAITAASRVDRRRLRAPWLLASQGPVRVRSLPVVQAGACAELRGPLAPSAVSPAAGCCHSPAGAGAAQKVMRATAPSARSGGVGSGAISSGITTVLWRRLGLETRRGLARAGKSSVAATALCRAMLRTVRRPADATSHHEAVPARRNQNTGTATPRQHHGGPPCLPSATWTAALPAVRRDRRLTFVPRCCCNQDSCKCFR